ncbi:MAG: hypothetical protein JJT89_15630 [Nitriliruptoraceae bacterium]|nr:hypothetical protein [Nitriliruptoraceae bacterium]
MRAPIEGTLIGVLRGLAAFRWLAWTWMALVLVAARGNLVAPLAAWTLVIAALLVTVWTTAALRHAPAGLLRGRSVGAEVGVALSLQLADGFVYGPGHVFSPGQPLGVAWPTAAVLSAGVAFGPVVGACTGLVVGGGRAVSSVLNVVPDADPWFGALTGAQTMSLVTTTVLQMLAGGVAGYATRLLQQAERRVIEAEGAIAELRTREDIARRLHDGVLQTLAVVERRAEDPSLAALAREQERDLRAYLFGTPGADVLGRGALGDTLRRAAARAERAFAIRVEVAVPDDLPELDGPVLEALGGAVGELLTNVGKHAGVDQAVVYAEPLDDGVFVSVRDQGGGFDPATVTVGIGLPRSVRARVEEIGGAVRVVSAPDRGTEVQLTVPVVASE